MNTEEMKFAAQALINEADRDNRVHALVVIIDKSDISKVMTAANFDPKVIPALLEGLLIQTSKDPSMHQFTEEREN